MKRTIRHPDGRVEEQEGTPAELAEFDRALHATPVEQPWWWPATAPHPDLGPPWPTYPYSGTATPYWLSPFVTTYTSTSLQMKPGA